MTPLLYNLTLIQNNDLICIEHGGQAMGNNDNCMILGNIIDRLLDHFF